MVFIYGFSCVSLITNDVEQYFMYLLNIHISFPVKQLLKPLSVCGFVLGHIRILFSHQRLNLGLSSNSAKS